MVYIFPAKELLTKLIRIGHVLRCYLGKMLKKFAYFGFDSFSTLEWATWWYFKDDSIVLEK